MARSVGIRLLSEEPEGFHVVHCMFTYISTRIKLMMCTLCFYSTSMHACMCINDARKFLQRSFLALSYSVCTSSSPSLPPFVISSRNRRKCSRNDQLISASILTLHGAGKSAVFIVLNNRGIGTQKAPAQMFRSAASAAIVYTSAPAAE